MARNYAAVPFEYRREMALLTDEEFGRLIRGLLAYAEEGTEIQAEGSEIFYVYRVCAQEDRFQENYEERTEQNRRNGRKGGRPPKKTPGPAERQALQDAAALLPAAPQSAAEQDLADQQATEQGPADHQTAEQEPAEQPAAEQGPAGRNPTGQLTEEQEPQQAAQTADPAENPPVFSETEKTETETETKTKTETHTETEIKGAAGGGARARVCVLRGERGEQQAAQAGAPAAPGYRYARTAEPRDADAPENRESRSGHQYARTAAPWDTDMPDSPENRSGYRYARTAVTGGSGTGAPCRPGTGPPESSRFGSHEIAAVQRLLRAHCARAG